MAQPSDLSVPQPALRILSIRVGKGEMTCRVQVAGTPFTSPDVIRRVLRECPHLLSHSCVNNEGETFGAVADHTDLPHLMEHVAIDLQTRRCPDPSRILCGVTRWEDRERGIACIRLNYFDDLVALEALKEAARIVSAAVASE